MKRHDSQIDPFNAGEPSLPWSDTSQQPLDESLGEACSLPEQGYDSPTKQRDNYDAPSSDVAEDPARARKRAKQAKAARKAAASREQGKVVKSIFIVMLVAVLLGLLGELVSCTMDTIGGAIESFTDEPTAEELIEEAVLRDPVDYDELSPEEQKVHDLTAQAIEDLNGENEDVRQMVQTYFERTLLKRHGYTAEELGIDSNAYVNWVTHGVEYSIYSVFAFTTFEDEENYGSAFFSVSAPWTVDFAEAFNRQLFDYLHEEGLDSSDGIMPNEKQRAEINDIYLGALESVADETLTQESCSLHLDYEDGAFSISEENRNQLVKRVFKLY